MKGVRKYLVLERSLVSEAEPQKDGEGIEQGPKGRRQQVGQDETEGTDFGGFGVQAEAGIDSLELQSRWGCNQGVVSIQVSAFHKSLMMALLCRWHSFQNLQISELPVCIFRTDYYYPRWRRRKSSQRRRRSWGRRSRPTWSPGAVRAARSGSCGRSTQPVLVGPPRQSGFVSVVFFLRKLLISHKRRRGGERGASVFFFLS